MSRGTWQQQRPSRQQGRAATKATVVEAIDETVPKTKQELAETVGISKQYLSELLQELKTEEMVTKGYVVNDQALYDSAGAISNLYDGGQSDAKRADDESAVLDLLGRLETVTTRQYEAARSAFLGEDHDQSAEALESLTNERYSAVLSELKSYTLTTDWPGNRIAADLSTIATNLEIIGDRACFIADVVESQDCHATGIVSKRMADLFELGARINECLSRILFECELSVHDQLREHEKQVHRDLNELFELVTAYDPDMYGYLVTITRALERSIYYWVNSAELAVQLHSGIRPEHTEI
jgi:phosphate uptake regulator